MHLNCLLNQARLFRQSYRETPFQRLTRLRMEKALHLPASTAETITAISRECGYDNPTRVAAAFRQAYGLSPREYHARTRI